MTFFLLCLLFVFLFYVVRPIWIAYRRMARQREEFMNMMNGFGGRAGASRESGAGGGRKAGWSATKGGKRKKIDAEVGEYVDFEEVEVTESTTQTDGGDGGSRVEFKAESQVTDVEWEDVK